MVWTPDLYSEGSPVKYQPGDHPYQTFSWFFKGLIGKAVIIP
jgi:hypothetical protein